MPATVADPPDGPVRFGVPFVAIVPADIAADVGVTPLQ